MSLAVPGIGIVPVTQGRCPRCRGTALDFAVDPTRFEPVGQWLDYKAREPGEQFQNIVFSVASLGVYAIFWQMKARKQKEELEELKMLASQLIPDSIKAKCRGCSLEWFPDEAFELSQNPPPAAPKPAAPLIDTTNLQGRSFAR